MHCLLRINPRETPPNATSKKTKKKFCAIRKQHVAANNSLLGSDFQEHSNAQDKPRLMLAAKSQQYNGKLISSNYFPSIKVEFVIRNSVISHTIRQNSLLH